MAKRRLDVLLVERGLAESRTQAQALVMAGLVPGYDKPGTQVDETVELTVEGKQPYVSRGGAKLANGLDRLGVDPAGLDCVDVGSSTGGFTDVLLQRGARDVIALDVGHGQLDWKLRQDPRVVVKEGVNARALTSADVAHRVDVVTIDVSCSSLKHIFPALSAFLASDADIVALVKPQFEAGRDEVGKGGVITDPAIHDAVVEKVTGEAEAAGFRAVAMTPSPITGAARNREFFLHLKVETVHHNGHEGHQGQSS